MELEKKGYMPTDHMTKSQTWYSLYEPNSETEQTIVFFSGIACKRFGHPMANEPRHAVADLVEMAADTCNVIFPEVHMPGYSDDTGPIVGLTVEEQAERVYDVLSHAKDTNGIQLGRVTYIGQSLGGLAVARFIASGGVGADERTIFWGPPTLEGKEHRDKLVSKFSQKVNTLTQVDDEGNGQLQFAGGRLLRVSQNFWQSLDENSLRVHHGSMVERCGSLVAVCASNDDYYPNNEEYLTSHTPDVRRFEIEGTSHTFRTEPMRQALRIVMRSIL